MPHQGMKCNKMRNRLRRRFSLNERLFERVYHFIKKLILLLLFEIEKYLFTEKMRKGIDYICNRLHNVVVTNFITRRDYL